MKDQLQYRGTISPYGTAIKQYSYKNYSVCVSYDDEEIDESKPRSDSKNILHVSFDCKVTGKMREADMLYCAQRLGLDASRPYKEYEIPSSQPLAAKRIIHYYEQAI